MGGMMTVDPWLLDLGSEGQPQLRVARALAAMQAAVTKHLEHIPAINQEYVRRQVRASARHGMVPKVMVRCLRCNAVATLNDWCYSAVLDEAERDRRGVILQKGHGMTKALFLYQCEGARAAAEHLRTLEDLDEGEVG